MLFQNLLFTKISSLIFPIFRINKGFVKKWLQLQQLLSFHPKDWKEITKPRDSWRSPDRHLAVDGSEIPFPTTTFLGWCFQNPEEKKSWEKNWIHQLVSWFGFLNHPTFLVHCFFRVFGENLNLGGSDLRSHHEIFFGPEKRQARIFLTNGEWFITVCQREKNTNFQKGFFPLEKDDQDLSQNGIKCHIVGRLVER